MTVTVSLTFANIEEAAAFLSGKSVNQVTAKVTVTPPAAAPSPALPAPTPAPSKPTVEAAPAPAAVLDFKADVVEALRAYSKKVDADAFRAYMSSLKVSKVTELADKPETWAGIVAHCNG